MRNSFLTGIFGLVMGLIISMAFTQAAQTAAPASNMQIASQAAGQVEMQRVAQGDAPGEIRYAIDSLDQAKGHLSKAGGEWGGHKAKAINYVNEALRELNLGVDWAHQHGTY